MTLGNLAQGRDAALVKLRCAFATRHREVSVPLGKRHEQIGMRDLNFRVREPFENPEAALAQAAIGHDLVLRFIRQAACGLVRATEVAAVERHMRNIAQPACKSPRLL